MTELTSATPIGADLADDCLMGIRQASVAGLRSVTPLALRQAGGLCLIQRQALGSAAATISFSSIPATFEDLVLVLEGRMTSTSDEPRLQFNGDTAANYDFRRANQFGTAGAVGSTYIEIGSLCGSGDPANYPGQIVAEMAAYARTSFYKTLQARGFNMSTSVSVGNIVDASMTSFWRSTVAINAILLSVAAGNFAAGTVASLYGKH